MRFIPALVACLLFVGCNDSGTPTAPNLQGPMGGAVPPGAPPLGGGGPGAPGQSTAAAAESVAVTIETGEAALSPDNTRIQFIGTHVGDKPDPRVGGFDKFTGTAKVDAEAKTLESVSVEIETASLFTPFQKLTDHLKSPDFFDVREHPQAAFKSTSIAPGAASGEYEITGTLSLHGVDKEITVPATIEIGDSGLTLRSEFSIDRTEWGMDFGPEQVEKQVAMTIVIGERTQLPASPGGFGGGGGAGPGGGASPGPGPSGASAPPSVDLDEQFKNRDANNDGKLTGDEISGRMRETIEETDTDKDGAITLEEFRARMKAIGPPAGSPGG